MGDRAYKRSEFWSLPQRGPPSLVFRQFLDQHASCGLGNPRHGRLGSLRYTQGAHLDTATKNGSGTQPEPASEDARAT
jgi:hypothetical protein